MQWQSKVLQHPSGCQMATDFQVHMPHSSFKAAACACDPHMGYIPTDAHWICYGKRPVQNGLVRLLLWECSNYRWVLEKIFLAIFTPLFHPLWGLLESRKIHHSFHGRYLMTLQWTLEKDSPLQLHWNEVNVRHLPVDVLIWDSSCNWCSSFSAYGTGLHLSCVSYNKVNLRWQVSLSADVLAPLASDGWHHTSSMARYDCLLLEEQTAHSPSVRVLMEAVSSYSVVFSHLSELDHSPTSGALVTTVDIPSSITFFPTGIFYNTIKLHSMLAGWPNSPNSSILSPSTLKLYFLP